VRILRTFANFWDFVRIRWLVKEYGNASTLMGIPPGMSSFIKYFVVRDRRAFVNWLTNAHGLEVMRTYHTRESRFL